jgi:hypothetical protein
MVWSLSMALTLDRPRGGRKTVLTGDDRRFERS